MHPQSLILKKNPKSVQISPSLPLPPLALFLLTGLNPFTPSSSSCLTIVSPIPSSSTAHNPATSSSHYVDVAGARKKESSGGGGGAFATGVCATIRLLFCRIQHSHSDDDDACRISCFIGSPSNR
ncbi:hypothetical protein ACLB2K_019096 [Fragaria x ananassa]